MGFFLMESTSINAHWKTSLNVGALVTLIAGVHYFYMREYWITVGSSPIVYRYIDWTLTVPLQMIEFFLILSAADPSVSGGMFWRLLGGTVLMLAFGYMGEEAWINAWLGFIVGMAGWAFILYEIFVGQAGSVAAGVSESVKAAFNAMRIIVSAVSPSKLNLIYNLADFLNKIAFCFGHMARGKAGDPRQGRRQKRSSSSLSCRFLKSNWFVSFSVRMVVAFAAHQGYFRWLFASWWIFKVCELQ